MILNHLHFSGTFRWTSDKDHTLLKEVRFLEPYLYKSGSKLAGQKWKEVADNLNCLQAFKDSPRDQRSVNVRERFQKRRRRTSEALQFLQVRSEKEEEARKEGISFKKEMAEKESEARREDIAHKREMASLEAKRQDQQLQMQQQQMQQMQTLMLAVVCKLNQNDK